MSNKNAHFTTRTVPGPPMISTLLGYEGYKEVDLEINGQVFHGSGNTTEEAKKDAEAQAEAAGIDVDED